MKEESMKCETGRGCGEIAVKLQVGSRRSMDV